MPQERRILGNCNLSAMNCVLCLWELLEWEDMFVDFLVLQEDSPRKEVRNKTSSDQSRPPVVDYSTFSNDS